MTKSNAILVATGPWAPDTWLMHMRDAFPDRDVLDGRGDHDLSRVRYVLTWHPPNGLLGRLPHLEVIFSLGAGVDHILREDGLPDVPIVRIVDPDLTARMTEWVVLQVLLHHRKQLAYFDQQRNRVWHEFDQPLAREVRVGIMGFGVLGQDAARALAGLGFAVAGWSRTPKSGSDIDTFHGRGGLAPFLARTDILVVLLPLTTATRGLIDADLIAKLAPDGALGGPVLINAGRGGLQVEADILAALDSGRLIGASLDVFETEPLPSESALWTHSKVVITPHAAASSSPGPLSAYVAERIRAHERGEDLMNVVDRTVGY